jgi:hypothetical protein
MAHTKRGRAKKALRDARQAELRVVEADVDALRDDEDVQFYDDVDVDHDDVLPYIVDDTGGEGPLDVDDVSSLDLPDDE